MALRTIRYSGEASASPEGVHPETGEPVRVGDRVEVAPRVAVVLLRRDVETRRRDWEPTNGEDR